MCCQSVRILGAQLGGGRKAVVELGAVHCRVAGWRQHWEFGNCFGLLILDQLLTLYVHLCSVSVVSSLLSGLGRHVG